eukprot:308515-Rhodomonas_salina.4
MPAASSSAGSETSGLWKNSAISSKLKVSGSGCFCASHRVASTRQRERECVCGVASCCCVSQKITRRERRLGERRDERASKQARGEKRVSDLEVQSFDHVIDALVLLDQLQSALL